MQSYRTLRSSTINWIKNHPSNIWRFTSAFIDMIATSEEAVSNLIHSVLPSIIYIPSVATPPIQCRIFKPLPSRYHQLQASQLEMKNMLKDNFEVLHPILTRMATQFPDPRLIQYDCGKLQQLGR